MTGHPYFSVYRKLEMPMIKLLSRLPMGALYAFCLLHIFAGVLRGAASTPRDPRADRQGLSGCKRRLSANASISTILKNFCDVMVEVLKSASISAAE